MVKQCIHIAQSIGSIPISPTAHSVKRRRMFATDEKSLKRDTKVQFFRGSSGPGGQNVNKVASAVRVRHIPSGITIVVKDERSQIQNERIAFQRLKERLEKLNKPRKPRRISAKLPRAAKEKRLQQKRHISQKKESRQPPRFMIE